MGGGEEIHLCLGEEESHSFQDHISALKMETTGFSETLMSTYGTAWCQPESSMPEHNAFLLIRSYQMCLRISSVLNFCKSTLLADLKMKKLILCQWKTIIKKHQKHSLAQ
jgi:hypothetical protein